MKKLSIRMFQGAIIGLLVFCAILYIMYKNTRPLSVMTRNVDDGVWVNSRCELVDVDSLPVLAVPEELQQRYIKVTGVMYPLDSIVEKTFSDDTLIWVQSKEDAGCNTLAGFHLTKLDNIVIGMPWNGVKMMYGYGSAAMKSGDNYFVLFRTASTDIHLKFNSKEILEDITIWSRGE